MEEMKLYLSSIVCVTCLSSDRDLNQLKSYEANLLPMLTFDMEEDKICWECRAMLLKFSKFQQRATRAHELMEDVLSGKKNIIQSLSSLKWEVNVDGKRKNYVEDESSTIVIKDVQNTEPDEQTNNDNAINDSVINVNPNSSRHIVNDFRYVYKGADDEDEVKDVNDFEEELHGNDFINATNDVHEINDGNEMIHDFPSNFDIDDETAHKLIDSMLETYLESSIKKENKNTTVWYRCNKCSVKYTNESQLVHHKKTYHKSPPRCKYCGKIFSTNYNLKIHEQIHTKPSLPTYSCNICGESYNDAMSVHLHLKNVHGYNTDKSLFCKKCDKYFKTKSMFASHMKIHSK